jgi:hypothetical protein
LKQGYSFVGLSTEHKMTELSPTYGLLPNARFILKLVREIEIAQQVNGRKPNCLFFGALAPKGGTKSDNWVCAQVNLAAQSIT